MALSAKSIISLLNIRGIGRTAVLCYAKYAEHLGVSVISPKDYLDVISECHDKEGCRVKVEGVSLNDIYAAEYNADKIIEECEKRGISIISYSDKAFPVKLRGIVAKKTTLRGKETTKDESPVILYYKGGNIERLNNVKSVAVIGTREPTPEGKTAGIFLSKAIAKHGINIVGGLAIGCDTFGHEGALEVNGMTTAFLAHGLHTIYPKENEALAKRIVDSGGLLVSEYPIGTEPYAPYFVERDRLQSGISDATIVVQTGIVGGTMHAIKATIMNKKPLFAIEYASDMVMRQEKVLGNRKLIMEGKAHPITSINIQECINKINGCSSNTVNDANGTQLTLW